MANVLGELFGNIASAIREKNGETGTMKPAEFPAKIAAIEAGGGSGSVQVYCKSVTAPATTAGTRVSVDFGFAPDFLLVIQKSKITLSSSKSYPIFRMGFSAAAQEAFALSGWMHSAYWLAVTTSRVENTMLTAPIDGNTAQHLYNADETGFDIGRIEEYSKDLYIIAMKLL